MEPCLKMSYMKKTPLLFILALSFAGFTTAAQTPGTITVKAGSPGAAIQPTMWGIFFEDINLAADGGVYAELVKNRSFEFNMPLMGWRERKKNGGEGALLVNNRSAVSPANPRYLHITLKN